VDELRAALELATEEELQELTGVLFHRKFNPLDYISLPDPVTIQNQDRQSWLDALEQRFRFLAADGVTVLLGKTSQLSYRQILVQVCRYLKIPHSSALSTTELEAEVFLYLLGRTWKQLPQAERRSLTQQVQGALSESQHAQQIPLPLQHDPIGLLVKGGSALAISSILRPFILQQIARQFALHFATYQVAQEALIRGGAAAAAQLQGQIAIQSARQGMALSATRYGMARGVLSVLGPAMWAFFFADLGWRAISTNYARVIPTIFALAQIRLTRSDCFELVYTV
jgi:uncharacterized protein YaaW (UPF0174 family)